MDNKPPVFQNQQAEGGSFFWEGKSEKTVGILLFHGFTATTVEVRPFAKFFHDKGYTVAGPLLPGHGVSPDELNQVSFKDWTACAERSYLELAQNFKRVIVIGESMGGLLTLWLGATHPEISGLLVFAPALRIPRLWQSNLAWPFINYMYKKNIDLNTPWQGFNVIPMRAASQLYYFQQRIKKTLPKITQPIYIFQGKLDTTIDPISAVDTLEAVSSVEKELIWLEDSTHCILLDKQMDIVEKISLEFVQKYR
jgi:carboxylesterase